MDSNLMSCPTCGHSVSNAAGACAYCGAMMEEKKQPAQADDKGSGTNGQVAASPPPLPRKQNPTAGTASDEAGEADLAAAEPPEPEVSPEPADSSATAETDSPATEAPAASPVKSSPAEDEADAKPAVDEQASKSAAPSGVLKQDFEDIPQIARSEAGEPASVSDAAPTDEKPGIQEPEADPNPDPDKVALIERQAHQTQSVTDDIQSPPEPAAADISGDETGQSDPPVETTAERAKFEAAPQESASPATSDMSPSPEKIAKAAKSKPEEELPPKKKADPGADAKAGPDSKSLGDTIVLEVADEVEPVAAASPDTAAEPAPAESRTEDQSKNRLKADLTKDQTLKNQKAVQAKVQALKRQKLVLAKAAALKRKKEIQAKAQASTEAAKKKAAAAAASASKSDPGPKTNSRMQTLLGKYKGRLIGINYDNSAEIRPAQVVEANAEYFSVFVKDQNLKYSYPLKAVLSIIEGKDGVNIGSSKQPNKFIAVIKLYPMVLF